MPTLPVRPLCGRGVEIACPQTAGVIGDPEADLAALARAAAAAASWGPTGSCSPRSSTVRRSLFVRVDAGSVARAPRENPHLADRRGSLFGPSAMR